jgi:hypothetical protein
MEIGPKLKILCDKKSYGKEISEIAIIPTIFSSKTYDVLQYKERKRYSPKTRAADIRILKTKVKKGFDGDRLEKDIRRLFDYRE